MCPPSHRHLVPCLRHCQETSWLLMQQWFLNFSLQSEPWFYSGGSLPHVTKEVSPIWSKPIVVVTCLLPVMTWAWTREAGLAWKTRVEAYGRDGASRKDLFTLKISLPSSLNMDVVGGDAWIAAAILVLDWGCSQHLTESHSLLRC